MTDRPIELRVAPEASGRPAGAARVVRWLYSSNPFYVLSADLVFIGLRMSFDPSAKAFDTWALLAGLAGYTLLLAATACLLVRYGRVWDDMRSVLLLVVMMFLAISASIDDVLIARPMLGAALAAGALAFAVGVSEGLLRGMRLGLPWGYRGPYYLILAVFFGYPLALRPLLDRPENAMSHWAVFGFSTAAGLAFLALIPAIRRGAGYVKGNGSPWRWPLYPWSLFFFLGLGVVGRSYYLCVSMHNVERYASIFGPYFLVPFGFAAAVLLLEAGRASGRSGVTEFALALPVGLVALAMVGHRPDAVYGRMLAIFRHDLGVAPPAAALILAAVFYARAGLRGVVGAWGLAEAALAATAVIGPDTLGLASLSAPNPWPLLAVGAVEIGLGVRRKVAGRALVGAICGVLAVGAWPGDLGTAMLRWVAAGHLAVAACLAIGAGFEGGLAGFLRRVGLVGLLAMGLGALAGDSVLTRAIPSGLGGAYPLAVAAVAAGYGVVFGGAWFLGAAGAILAGIVSIHGARWYVVLRREVAGLDRIALGLASFALAAGISVRKAGLIGPRSADRPPAPEPPSGPMPA